MIAGSVQKFVVYTKQVEVTYHVPVAGKFSPEKIGAALFDLSKLCGYDPEYVEWEETRKQNLEVFRP